MDKSNITALETACREHGLKVTHQRIEVFKAIMKAVDHPSVEDIYAVVKRRMPTISLDTVYRTVDTFEQIGLVSRLTGSDGRFRFDTNLDTHQHLVCTRCNRIEDVYWDDLQQLSPPRTTGWSDVSVAHVELKGLCSQCKNG